MITSLAATDIEQYVHWPENCSILVDELYHKACRWDFTGVKARLEQRWPELPERVASSDSSDDNHDDDGGGGDENDTCTDRRGHPL